MFYTQVFSFSAVLVPSLYDHMRLAVAYCSLRWTGVVWWSETVHLVERVWTHIIPSFNYRGVNCFSEPRERTVWFLYGLEVNQFLFIYSAPDLNNCRLVDTCNVINFCQHLFLRAWFQCTFRGFILCLMVSREHVRGLNKIEEKFFYLNFCLDLFLRIISWSMFYQEQFLQLSLKFSKILKI